MYQQIFIPFTSIFIRTIQQRDISFIFTTSNKIRVFIILDILALLEIHIFQETSIQHPHLIFTDEDNMDVNHYEAVVTGGEEEDLLQPICNKHRDTRIGNQTAIHCRK